MQIEPAPQASGAPPRVETPDAPPTGNGDFSRLLRALDAAPAPETDNAAPKDEPVEAAGQSADVLPPALPAPQLAPAVPPMPLQATTSPPGPGLESGRTSRATPSAPPPGTPAPETGAASPGPPSPSDTPPSADPSTGTPDTAPETSGDQPTRHAPQPPPASDPGPSPFGDAALQAPDAPRPAQADRAVDIPRPHDIRVADPAGARALSVQIVQPLDPGRDGTFEVALEPEELGHVRLSLTTTDHGVTVQVQADRQDTLDLMRRHAAALAREFRDAGFGAVDLGFSSQSGRRDKPPDSPPSATGTGPDTGPGPRQTIHTTLRAALSDGRLDLRF
jgi:flagellar hook-length control protein FliK